MTDPALLEALQGLATAEPLPAWFERVSRWRRRCGDAEAAARWQLWSLMPPPQAELQQALAQLWMALGELDQAERLLAGHAAGWDRLALLLEQGALEPAQALQQVLLADPPPLPEARLLALAGSWKRAERPAQALALLERLLAHYSQAERTITPGLANALAHLLEQDGRWAAAAHWWRHSLLQEPDQLPPMMRLARQALREQQPATAVHYTRQVLARDPGHAWAPQLLRQALLVLGARGSLALQAGEPLPAPWQRRQQRWLQPLAGLLPSQTLGALGARGPVALLPPAAAGGAQQLALWADSDGLALAALLLDAAARAELRLIWLLASPEPLLQARNLARLLPASGGPELRSWPHWEAGLHGAVDVLALARPARRAGAPPPGLKGGRLWRRGPEGWTL